MEKKMSDRFDLEEQMLNCWNVTKDINVLTEGVMEKNLTQDQIANALMGLEQMYDLKFDKMWTTFTKLIEDKKIL
jgi:hypothetical protein